MPRAQPVPLRPAAEAASAQRPRRTRPRLVAIRGLRRRRPPLPPQTPPAPPRPPPPSAQSPQASPSPWPSPPSRVPLNHQPGDRPVSHGLNSDTPLTARFSGVSLSCKLMVVPQGDPRSTCASSVLFFYRRKLERIEDLTPASLRIGATGQRHGRFKLLPAKS